MYRIGFLSLQPGLTPRVIRSSFCRVFSSSAPAEACNSRNPGRDQASSASTGCGPASAMRQQLPSAWKMDFWTCRSTWKRAGLNTLRCLVGCSIGDFSVLWMFQTYYLDLGMGTIMAASSKFHAEYVYDVERVYLTKGWNHSGRRHYDFDHS